MQRLNPNQMYSLGSDSKKIFCAYHDTEFLTNFCQQKQCLMPLCPSCIAQHTQEHFREGKKPTYTNINEALNKAKQSCYCTIITLQEYKKLNADIYGYITTLEQNIHLQLVSKRQELFDIITDLFTEYEARLIRQIHENYEEKSVYLMEEAINASKFIDEEISNLYEKISLLKGEDCLSALITYYAVDDQNYKEALQEFDEYFQKNRKAGKLEVSIVENVLKNLTNNLCDNLLSVECVIENFEAKPEEPEEQSGLKSKRYGFNKNAPPNQTLKASRNDVYEKENQGFQQKQLLVKSRRSKEKIGLISRQEKQASFANQNAKPPLPVNRNSDLISEGSIIRQKSIGDSMEQDSKRLTRSFKRQP